ncbi:hypothetical protein FSP39_007547 [Pinctada imbricata]|uniref:Fibrinogen C-terminal domain-containing protein n=1 Tax=Pinctada imbricata TaxID=66713 RepID=A0AA88YQ28_PINIB|nr:hypothetical protein FSP39_007547 [Pinctada imbricata]
MTAEVDFKVKKSGTDIRRMRGRLIKELPISYSVSKSRRQGKIIRYSIGTVSNLGINKIPKTCTGVPYELGNKNAISRRRRNVATNKRELQVTYVEAMWKLKSCLSYNEVFMMCLFVFLLTVVVPIDCQSMVSNSDCPAVDELLRVSAKERIELENEIAKRRSDIELLSRELTQLGNVMMSVVMQTNAEIVIDCSWHKRSNPLAKSGIYYLHIAGERTFPAFCDMETDKGGWTVIMSRERNMAFNFNRTWEDYKRGFGNVSGDYWIGNDIIHKITKHRPSELYFKIHFIRKPEWIWDKYKNVTVQSEGQNYRLSFDEDSYTGNDRDRLGFADSRRYSSKNMFFSTYDRDNDRDVTNCAMLQGGGWWFNDCGYSMTRKEFGFWGFTKEGLKPGKRNCMMLR